MRGDLGMTAPGGLVEGLARLWQRTSRGGSTLATEVVRAADEDAASDTTAMAAAEEYIAARQAAGATPRRRRFDVDVHVSRLEFCARFLGLLQVRGSFAAWEGSIDLVDGYPLESRVEARVRTASLRTGISLRDRHLRGRPFLDAAEYPEISFRGESVESHSTHFTIRGALTLRGVTREESIEFVPVPPLPGTSAPPLSLRFRGSLTVRRSEYGIWSPPTIGTFFGLRPRIIGDSVRVEFEVVAVSEHFSATVSSARAERHGGAAADH
ncbi:MAG TPA: YceI family protein [Gemmatimonadaceae bacterium]|nr:YceI family protein [Gemmatimonadaceae bacterium]